MLSYCKYEILVGEDKVYKESRGTLHQTQEEEDEMVFSDTLKHEVLKRQFLIFEKLML